MAPAFDLKSAPRGFTLVELMVATALVAVLASLSFSALGQMRSSARAAQCVNNLRQLGIATNLYLGDHNQVYFKWKTAAPTGGTLYYYGLELGSTSKAEGSRTVDETAGPLYPYIQQVGGIVLCPAFAYDSALWKAKYTGASYGYGINTFLSNRSATTLGNAPK